MTHRNMPGVYDSYQVFSGRDEAAVRNILVKRKADIILMCPNSSHDSYFLFDGRAGTFYQRLITGTPPAWVRKIPLTGKAAEAFRMFEVDLSRP